MTQKERYMELLAAEANRHCAMAQITAEPALKSAHLDVSLACWAGVAALRGEVVPCRSEGKRPLRRPRFFRRSLAWIRIRAKRIHGR